MIKAIIINTDTRQVCHTLTEQCSINPEGYAKQYLRENLGRFPNYCIEMVDTQGRNGFGEVFKRINHGHLPGSFAQSGLLSEEVNHLPKDSARELK